MKRCTRCGVERDLSEFYRRPNGADGHRPVCIPCTRAAARARYLDNRESERDRRYQARYAQSALDVDEMRRAQGYCCLICGKHEHDLGQILVVDHCHITGIIRGMLCPGCNTGFGHFGESPEVLRAATEYAKRAYELVSIYQEERTP